MAYHPEGRRRGEGEPEEPAAASSWRRPSARTAERSPSTSRHLRADRRDAAAQRAGRPQPSRSWPSSRTTRSSSRKTCCRGPTANGDSARRNSYRKLELELDAGLTARSGAGARPRRKFARVERRDVRHRPAAVGPGFSREAAAARRSRRAGARRSARCSPRSNLEHGKPEDLVARRRRRRWPQIKTFIKENDILRLPDPDRCQVDRDAGVPARQLDGLPEPGPAARPRRPSSFYAISPPPKDWDERRVPSYLEEYNSHMLHDPHHPRGVSGPLRPAGILATASRR